MNYGAKEKVLRSLYGREPVGCRRRRRRYLRGKWPDD